MKKARCKSEGENMYYLHENKKKIEEDIEWSKLNKLKK